MDARFAGLKMVLHSLGALNPGAWEALAHHIREIRYAAERPVRLEAGGLIFLDEGLLKQYARHGRTQPAINGFIQRGGLYAMPQDPNPIYIKAILPSVVYCCDGSALRELLRQHASLLTSYMKIRDAQEAGLDSRLRLLEQKGKGRLDSFASACPGLRAVVKGKDISNYLSLNYTYVSHIRDK